MLVDRLTTRFCRRALADLTAGHSVTIVAYPHSRAITLARIVCQMARDGNVPCSNLRGCDTAAPRVKVREYDAVIPFPTPAAKVHIDLSAVFERQRQVPPRVRTVEPV